MAMGAGIIFVVSCVTAVIGAAVAWRSRRWRRAGDHPHCRRCDFNLTGLPADAGRCPECGADLAAPKARVIGAKRPARFVQGIAAAVAVIGVGVAIFAGGRIGWVELRVRHSPTAWLIRDVGGPWGTLPAAATAELERRLYDDATDVPTRVAIVRALRRDTLTARPTMRAGDVLPIACKLDSVRPSSVVAVPATAGPPTQNYMMQGLCVGASIVGGPRLAATRYGVNRFPINMSGATLSQRLTPPPGVAAGPARVRIVYEYRLMRGDANDRLDLRRFAAESSTDSVYDHDRDAPCVAIWDEAWDLPITVVPADATDDVTLVSAAKAGVDLATFVKVPAEVQIEQDRYAPPGRQPDRTARINFVFPGRLPVGVAYDVLIRDAAGAEARVGSITCQPDQVLYTSSYARSDDVPAILAWSDDHADVVLRPSVSAARMMMVVAPIVSDEIVFKAVPVKLPEPVKAPEPTTRPKPTTRRG